MAIFSKIVVKNLKIIIMVIDFAKLYPACQTDANRITPGSNLTFADKRVVEASKVESLGIKLSECDV